MNSSPSPIAISQYAEKSKYNWNVYAREPTQASKKSILKPFEAVSNTGFAYSLMFSAKITFLNNPKKKTVMPIVMHPC
jgi:hypothetical protein